MRLNTLSALALIPLAACFEVVIPEEPDPAPADLQNGEWAFEMVEVATHGRCASVGMMPEPYLLYGWVETYGEAGVSIDLEGIWFDGERDGDRLYAEGYELYDYGDGEPMPAEDPDDEPGASEGSSGDGEVGEADGGVEADAKCEPYPDEEPPFATMAADILDPSHMVGVIEVDLSSWGEACVIEISFEAEALDDCDCGCEDEDDVIVYEEGEGGTSRG
jgi:hypothetical protein